MIENDKMNELFEFLLETMVATKDFTLEQAPLLAQELILFNRVWLSVIIIFSICLMYCAKYIKRNLIGVSETREGSDKQAGYVVLSMSSSISSIIGVIIFFLNIRDVFLVWSAPKLFLLEHLANLVSKG